MKVVKYYYSKCHYLAYCPVITDANGEPLFIASNKSAKTKRLPRVTVASVYDTDTNTMTFGVAVCSPKDIFNKRTGRQIAFNRATLNAETTIVGINRRRIREVSKDNANKLIEKHLAKYNFKAF